MFFWLLIVDSSSIVSSLSALVLSPCPITLTSRKKSRTFVSEETASSAAAGGVGRRPIWARAASERRIGSFCFTSVLRWAFRGEREHAWRETEHGRARTKGAETEMEIKEKRNRRAVSFSLSLYFFRFLLSISVEREKNVREKT